MQIDRRSVLAGTLFGLLTAFGPWFQGLSFTAAALFSLGLLLTYASIGLLVAVLPPFLLSFSPVLSGASSTAFQAHFLPLSPIPSPPMRPPTIENLSAGAPVPFFLPSSSALSPAPSQVSVASPVREFFLDRLPPQRPPLPP